MDGSVIVFVTVRICIGIHIRDAFVQTYSAVTFHNRTSMETIHVLGNERYVGGK
jgi:hypothetical protein